jgi:hypothetical protein
MRPIPLDRLKELFRYDPETGDFIRLKSPSKSANTSLNSVAGGPDGLGYIRIRIDGHKYRAHRLAWLYIHGAWPENQIDHINGNRSDNRISNLRDVTRGENIQNQKSARIDNKTGLLGVSRLPSGKYKASIGFNGVKRHLGQYDTPELAYEMYMLAKDMVHVSSA